MNYFHSYWCGNKLPLAAHNNLAQWSEKLSATKFLHVLWVNHDLYHSMLKEQPEHNVVADDKAIFGLLSLRQRESYFALRGKVGLKGMFFWRFRKPDVRYSYAMNQKMNIVVINIEAYFDYLATINVNFFAVKSLFCYLNQQKLYAYVKDSMSQFIISLLGGIYCDVDIAPDKTQSFFDSMGEFRKMIKLYPASLKNSGHIFSILHRHNHKVWTDVCFLINTRCPAQVVDNKKLDMAISADELYAMKQQISAFKTLDETSGRKRLSVDKGLEAALAQIYHQSPCCVEYLLVKHYYQNMNDKSGDLELLDVFEMLLEDAITVEFDLIHQTEKLKGTELKYWLANVYSPFYDAHIRNKFKHPDPTVSSSCEKLGYYYLSERIKAANVLGIHYRFLSTGTQAKSSFKSSCIFSGSPRERKKVFATQQPTKDQKHIKCIEVTHNEKKLCAKNVTTSVGLSMLPETKISI